MYTYNTTISNLPYIFPNLGSYESWVDISTDARYSAHELYVKERFSGASPMETSSRSYTGVFDNVYYTTQVNLGTSVSDSPNGSSFTDSGTLIYKNEVIESSYTYLKSTYNSWESIQKEYQKAKTSIYKSNVSSSFYSESKSYTYPSYPDTNNPTYTVSALYSSSTSASQSGSSYVAIVDYSTVQSTTYFITQTGAETTDTKTTSETYKALYRFSKKYTATTADELSPFKTSTTKNITYTYLSQTTMGAEINTYFTITTYSSLSSYIFTTTNSNKLKTVLTLMDTTSSCEPYGCPAIVLVNINNNWYNGELAGFLRNYGENNNLVQKFSDLSVVSTNETLLPPTTVRTYEFVAQTNNDTENYSYYFPVEYNEPYNNSFFTLSETTISNYLESGSSVKTETDTYLCLSPWGIEELYLPTSVVCDSCSYGQGQTTSAGYETIDVSTTHTRIAVYGYPSSTIISTYWTTIYTEQTAERTLLAATTTLVSESNRYWSHNHYYSSQGFSFDTKTAIGLSHVGQEAQSLAVTGRKLGVAFSGNIYLDTSNTNKTDNTGYYGISNNLSLDIALLTSPLLYNANTIITNDNQLYSWKSEADYLYKFPHFDYTSFEDVNPEGWYYAVTPNSQSSYTLDKYDSSASTGCKYTISYFGSNNGSYSSQSYSPSSAGSLLTGILSHDFNTPAESEAYSYGQDYQKNLSAGGKRALYTDTQKLYVNSFPRTIKYKMRDNHFLKTFAYNYYMISYLSVFTTGTGTLSTGYGSLSFLEKEITDLNLFSFDNDSWVATEADGKVTSVETGNTLPYATQASYAKMANPLNTQSYYGSTYFKY